MDTLAYFHLAQTYEASASEPETLPDYGLLFHALNWTKCRSSASIPLIVCVITLFTLSLASPSQALEKGNESSQVTELQKKLQAAGYFNGPVTGYYGTLTQQAVSEFQKAKGFTANGIADEVTLNALAPETPTPSQEQPSPSELNNNPQVEATSPRSNNNSQVEASPTPALEKGINGSHPALEKGISGSQVTALQKQLQAAGYFDGPVTGYYGALTQQAVIDFQTANGIVPNGVADTSTLQALNTETPTPSQPATPPPVVADKPKTSANYTKALEKGISGSQVTALQKKLQTAGYFDGPVTGYYGSLTQQAVIAFQKAHGIIPDGIADTSTLKALESTEKPTPSKPATPKKEITDNSKAENQDDLDTPQQKSPTIQKTPEKASPPVQKTPNKVSPTVENTPEEIAPSPQEKPPKDSPVSADMKLKKTISGKISPKSIVHSGNGLFFAQNMMYSHTITVYDRNHNLVKTITDAVSLPKYGYSKFKGNYKGAPVEAAFSHDGEYAWVSNYQMYGSGFDNPGSDDCSPAQRTDKSFLYRINTENMGIEKVIQVGSVPKFVATTPDNNLVLVSNWCSWDLSVVDTEKNKEVKRIQLGRYPRGIVVDSDSEKAYIAVMGSYDIAAVDLKNFSVGWLRNVGNSPRHLNIDPADKYLYSTLNGEGKIAKIDLATDKIVKKISTGSQPRSMVISDDGQLLYVVNYGSNTVSKVRTSDMKILKTVNVNSSPIGITYDPQTREVWVACYSGSIMVFQD